MGNYIKNITINNFICLNNLDISIQNPHSPHLFITGENGSGKTILLNIIASELRDISGRELCRNESLHNLFNKNITTNPTVTKVDKNGKTVISTYDILYAADWSIEYSDMIKERLKSDDFLLRFYSADRMPKMKEPKSPTKPNLTKKIDLTSQFLYFLSDLKIQELLAKGDDNEKEANELGQWFMEFQELLRIIYNDNNLELKFNRKLYSFFIESNEKSFKFTQLSDGYAAILEIVTDLILSMQENSKYIRAYEKEGIVLIDEVETHLHLALQKNIMPILTKIFPNIQFIITTHSPFVLNSLSNSVAYDLERKEIINELSEYSYEALAEGYFGVKTSSSYLEMRLNELNTLLLKDTVKTPYERYEISRLIEDLSKISEAASPTIVGRFNELRLKYASIIKELGND